MPTTAGKMHRSHYCSKAEHRLARGAEVCLALTVLVPPFVFGARQAYGQLVLAVLVLAAAGFCVLRLIARRPARLSWWRPEILLPLAGLALSALQWLRLPPHLVQTLSPGVGRLLPAWATGALGEVSHGGWPYFSLAPGLSRDATFLFLLYSLLFWATLVTVRSTGSVRRLLWMFFLAGVGVAAVGLVRYLFWNGKFYGVWDIWWVPLERQVREPFTNRNHFAGFLALTVAPGMASLAWLLRRREFTMGSRADPPRDLVVLLTGLGLTLILVGILLSQSRGGALVGMLALGVACLGLFPIIFRRGRGLALCGVVGLGSLVLLVTFGNEDCFKRLGDLLTDNQPLDTLSGGRLSLWQADLHAVFDFPLLGSGTGTHAYVYPLYFERMDPKTYTHAENGYVQVLMECGLVGAALLGVVILCLGGWCLRAVRGGKLDGSDPAGPAALAIGISVAVALLHSLVDFVWYVPAYAAALSLLAGLACYLGRRQTSAARNDRPEGVTAPVPVGGRVLWGAACAGVWVLLAAVVGSHFIEGARAEYAWNSYYFLSPPDPTGKGPGPGPEIIQEQADWLAEACRHRDSEPDYFYRLGLLEQEEFSTRGRQKQNALSLAEMGQIVESGHFATPAEGQAWLRKWSGRDLALLEQSRAHLRRSLACCPLQGLAYVRLAELRFLDLPSEPGPTPYLQQALLVRPNDPEVCFEVGVKTGVAGDLPAARRCLQRACEMAPALQVRLVPLLAAQLPAAQVVSLVHPALDCMKWLAHQQLAKGRLAAQRNLTAQARQEVEGSSRSRDPDSWITLAEMYRESDRPEEAEACLRRAVDLGPTQPQGHVHLARWLMERHRWDEAVEQTRRALALFPEHPDVRALQRDLLKKGLQSGQNRLGNHPS